MPIDPVCGVEIDTERAASSVEHAGQDYYFCSVGCAERFESEPHEHLETPHPHLMTVGGMVSQQLPFTVDPEDFDLEIQESGTLQVGDRSAYTKTITESDVTGFAEVTGDTNALHLNEEFASQTRFGHRIAHGTLLAGTISAALAALPGLTIYLSETLEFERPVDIGATVVASCEIVERLENDRFRLTTRVETGEGNIAISGTATVLIDPLPIIETD